MNEKRLLIGNLGEYGGCNCGQTIKTKNIYEMLLLKTSVEFFDTGKLTKNPLFIVTLLLKIIKNDKFYILPAQRALPILSVLLFLLNKKNVNYIVIGGWLPNYLSECNYFFKYIIKSKFRVFVELKSMKRKLDLLGVNSFVLPNFKTFNLYTEENNLSRTSFCENNIKLVFLSRVEETKGVLLLLDALLLVHESYSDIQISLDIYGKCDSDFLKELNFRIGRTREKTNFNINYKGLVCFSEVQNTLLDYDFFVFPTYYVGEGFPGVIIDAFSSGLPVICSDWNYNTDLVSASSGFLHRSQSPESLSLAIIEAVNLSYEEYVSMSNICLRESRSYHIATVSRTFEQFNLFD